MWLCYDNEELLEEVKQDLVEFGSNLQVNCPSLKTEAYNSRPYGQW